MSIFILSNKDIIAQKYEFGIAGYTSSYMGDLNPNNFFYFTNFGGGVFGKYNLNSTWAFRLNYNYLALSANDTDFKSSNQRSRKLAFNNNISELSASTEFNFLRYNPNSRKKYYTPYFTAGIGIIKHKPSVYYGGKKIDLYDLKLEVDKQGRVINYSTIAVVLPLGIGFKYNIKGPWTIAAELNYRIASTDYIDNVGGYYSKQIPENATLPNIQVTTENGIIRKFSEGDWYYLSDPSNNYAKNVGTLRGDGRKWDSYLTTGITLSYSLKSYKCNW